jgi:8-oxo-dGTP pyrophosphatase MutT (NUDIX family)
MSLKKWSKLSEKTLFENDHWQYKLDEFEIEGKLKGKYHYVHSPGSTLIVPFTSKDEIILVNQYRYLNQKEGLEFPCGAISGNLSEKENALKELREESGYMGKLERIGEFVPYTGVSDEVCHVFIGTDLVKSPLAGDATEEFEIVRVTVEELDRMIKDNIIWDGLTLSAWLLVKNHLNI